MLSVYRASLGGNYTGAITVLADLIYLFSIFVIRASSQPSYFARRLSTSESFSGLCFRNRDTTLEQTGLTVSLPTSLNRFVGTAAFSTEATDVVPPDMAMKQFLTLSIAIVLFQWIRVSSEKVRARNAASIAWIDQFRLRIQLPCRNACAEGYEAPLPPSWHQVCRSFPPWQF
jgi:hypothetical protein